MSRPTSTRRLRAYAATPACGTNEFRLPWLPVSLFRSWLKETREPLRRNAPPVPWRDESFIRHDFEGERPRSTGARGGSAVIGEFLPELAAEAHAELYAELAVHTGTS